MNAQKKENAANIVRTTGMLLNLDDAMEESKTARIQEEEKV